VGVDSDVDGEQGPLIPRDGPDDVFPIRQPFGSHFDIAPRWTVHMVKLVLLKRPKEGVSREKLVEYLETVHGPHNAELPGVDYTLSTQVDPEEEDAIDDDREYYDSNETVPVDPDETRYDSLEIHEFESIEALIKAHSTEYHDEAAESVQDVIDFEDEIAFVVRDRQPDT
jgi:hypothetical protein